MIVGQDVSHLIATLHIADFPLHSDDAIITRHAGVFRPHSQATRPTQRAPISDHIEWSKGESLHCLAFRWKFHDRVFHSVIDGSQSQAKPPTPHSSYQMMVTPSSSPLQQLRLSETDIARQQTESSKTSGDLAVLERYICGAQAIVAVQGLVVAQESLISITCRSYQFTSYTGHN